MNHHDSFAPADRFVMLTIGIIASAGLKMLYIIVTSRGKSQAVQLKNNIYIYIIFETLMIH